MNLALANEVEPDGRANGALKQRVHRRLIAQSADDIAPADDTAALRARLGDLLRDEQPLLSSVRFDELLEQLTHEVAGLGPLEPLLADPTVTEVMVNGPGRGLRGAHGLSAARRARLDATAIVRLVERVVAPLGLRLDRASPMVDARLPDGSRLHAVIPPLAVDGPCVTIRRFGARAVPLDEFGWIRPSRRSCVGRWRAGWNVAGRRGRRGRARPHCSTRSSRRFRPSERIVTIEETAELRLAQPHVVRLEARPPNAEGAGGVTVRALVRAALRMRPDRLVVGEVRGGEALDMLQALQHRSRRFDVDDPRQRSGRRTGAARDARAPGRLGAPARRPSARRWRRASTRSCSSRAGGRRSAGGDDRRGRRPSPERCPVALRTARRADSPVALAQPARRPDAPTLGEVWSRC